MDAERHVAAEESSAAAAYQQVPASAHTHAMCVVYTAAAPAAGWPKAAGQLGLLSCHKRAGRQLVICRIYLGAPALVV
jgi:hypothetical protein